MEPSKQRDGVAPGCDETAAVVERLREWVRHNGGRDSSGFSRSINVEEVAEAADLLERLSAERARVIEECAKIAETFNAYTSSVPGQYVQGNENAKRGIAAAIRALGSPKP